MISIVSDPYAGSLCELSMMQRTYTDNNHQKHHARHPVSEQVWASTRPNPGLERLLLQYIGVDDIIHIH